MLTGATPVRDGAAPTGGDVWYYYIVEPVNKCVKSIFTLCIEMNMLEYIK